MPIDDKILRLSGNDTRRPAPGPLAKALTWVVGAVALAGALVFSAALFAVLLLVGAAVGGWLWWQTRALRRQLRERMQQMQQMEAGVPGSRGAEPRGSGPHRTGPHRTGPGRTGPGRAGPGGDEGEVIDGDFIRETKR